MAGSSSVTFCVLVMMRLPTNWKGSGGGGGAGGGLDGGGLDGGGLGGGGDDAITQSLPRPVARTRLSHALSVREQVPPTFAHVTRQYARPLKSRTLLTP